jgi:tRNA threonylcarbamoyladenosine biosynthesis protein TsaB
VITLALDASTYAGSVAILDDNAVLAEETVAMRGESEERLMPAVAAVLARAALAVADIDRIVCGAGPGSFTSLRIAGSIAKGIATGVVRPLYAVPSLALIVAAEALPSGTYLATLDALREDRYVGLYRVDGEGEVHELEEARIVRTADLDAAGVERGAAIIGPDLIVEGDWGARHMRAAPHARGVGRLGGVLATQAPVDIASWEPRYGRLAEAQRRWESAHGRSLAGGR